MAITVCGNCVDFGTQCIQVTPNGIFTSGRFKTKSTAPGGSLKAFGTVAGYITGGANTPTTGGKDYIDKFPFSSDTSSTDVGELSTGAFKTGGWTSGVNGYTVGGPGFTDLMRFPFASDTPATTLSTDQPCICTSHSINGPAAGYTVCCLGRIMKFSYATENPFACVGVLNPAPAAYNSGGGHATADCGFLSAGFAPSRINSTRFFSFANENMNTFGTGLPCSTAQHGTSSSCTHGYTLGGSSPTPGFHTNIFKFPFAGGSPATDVGELTGPNRTSAAGNSSESNGYASGGGSTPNVPAAYAKDIMDKFPFASDTSATDIGELTICRTCAASNINF